MGPLRGARGSWGKGRWGDAGPLRGTRDPVWGETAVPRRGRGCCFTDIKKRKVGVETRNLLIAMCARNCEYYTLEEEEEGGG